MSAATGFASAFYFSGQPKIHRARSMIQIDPKSPETLGSEVQDVEELGSGYYSQEYDKTQYELLQNRSLAEQVVQRLDLQTTRRS